MVNIFIIKNYFDHKQGQSNLSMRKWIRFVEHLIGKKIRMKGSYTLTNVMCIWNVSFFQKKTQTKGVKEKINK